MNARRRIHRRAESPAIPNAERRAILLHDFRGDLTYWIGSDPRLALKIMRLIEDVLRDPGKGLGKPEPLRYDSHGQWSRRITDEHRLIYRVVPSGILFIYARGHYDVR